MPTIFMFALHVSVTIVGDDEIGCVWGTSLQPDGRAFLPSLKVGYSRVVSLQNKYCEELRRRSSLSKVLGKLDGPSISEVLFLKY